MRSHQRPRDGPKRALTGGQQEEFVFERRITGRCRLIAHGIVFGIDGHVQQCPRGPAALFGSARRVRRAPRSGRRPRPAPRTLRLRSYKAHVLIIRLFRSTIIDQ